MKVYLAKFEKDGKVAYKIGHTKWFIAEKRFADSQYKKFDNITILDDIYIQHADPGVARSRVAHIEKWLQCMFYKDFRLEDYFQTPTGYFDQLSGITEMFILDKGYNEQYVRKVFSNAKRLAKELYD